MPTKQPQDHKTKRVSIEDFQAEMERGTKEALEVPLPDGEYVSFKNPSDVDMFALSEGLKSEDPIEHVKLVVDEDEYEKVRAARPSMKWFEVASKFATEHYRVGED